jgi:hypothetical protein
MYGDEMSNNTVNVKAKFNFKCIFSKKVLLFVSLLFIALFISSPVISVVNGASTVVSDVVVRNETELLKAVGNAPDNMGYVIGLGKNIVLENVLEIPVGKNITLVSVGGFWSLTGAEFKVAVVVYGLLTIDGINVTKMLVHPDQTVIHAGGVNVAPGGNFILVSGKISNYVVDGYGGGVNNKGTFVMLGGEISDNGAFFGGGVYNDDGGNFTMLGGKISNNGGGVYTLGVFTMISGEIIDNYGYGVYCAGGVFDRVGGVIQSNVSLDGSNNNDVYYTDCELQGNGLFSSGDWWLYILLIGIAVVAIVVGLFFYRSKRRKHTVA